MFRSSIQSLALLTMVIAGCTVNTKVPDGARIACASSNDCPEGLQCRSLGYCVANDAESEPAAIVAGSVSLTPERVTQGVPVIVQFTVTEALSAEPVVILTGLREHSFTLVEADGLTYSFRAVFDVADGASSWPITAALVDLAGNPSSGLNLDTLTLDFAAPALSAPVTMTPNVVGTNDTVEFTVVASEELDGVPIVELVTLDGSTFQPTPLSQDDALHSYTFTYDVSGDEGEGFVDLTVSMSDVAGNIAAMRQGEVLRFDQSGPQVVVGSESHLLMPGPNNIFNSVPAATIGTLVRIGFSLDEDIADGTTPTVTAEGFQAPSGPTTSIEFDVESLGTRNFLYTFTLSDPSMAEADYTISVSAEDSTGNSHTSTFAGFHVDTHAPLSPDVSGGQVLYRRVPWGAIATSGERIFALEAFDNAVEDDAYLAVYDAEDPQNAARIGLAQADSNGAVAQFELNAVDRSRIYVTAVDSAGNESAAVLVRSVEWTASLGNKRTFSYIENPHEVSASPHFLFDRVDQTLATHGGLIPNVDLLDSTSTTTSGGVAFTQAPEYDDLPPTGGGFAMAWTNDSYNATNILFGGGYSPSDLTATTLYSYGPGYGWGPGLTTGPTPRRDMAMVGDERSGKVVLFGGADPTATCPGASNGCCRDTWVWNRTNWTQVSITGPSARCGHSMVYDSKRQRVLLFGGRTKADCGASACEVNDVWTFDGLTNTWTLVATTGTAAARSSHGAAYDSARDRMVVFGGRTDVGNAGAACPASIGGTAGPNGYCVFGDTLELNGTVWSTAAGTPPVARYGHAMAYDASRRVVATWGGASFVDCDGPGSSGCKKLYTFDGTTWRSTTAVTDAESFATPGEGVAMSYEPHSGQMILVDTAGNTWGVDLGATAKPGHLERFAFDATDASGAPVAFINFQPPGYATPDGYLADEGEAYGVRTGGLSYGWNGATCTRYEVLNDPSLPDARYDTRNSLFGSGASPCAKWELGLPNGRYRVFVVSDYTKGGLLMEGQLVVGQAEEEEFYEPNAIVDVADGKLTLTMQISQISQLNFIHVYKAEQIDEMSVVWAGSASGQNQQPYESVQLHVSGSTGTSFSPTYTQADVLADLIGKNPNRRWRLLLINSSGTVTTSLSSWCININGTGATCSSPGIASVPNGLYRDSINKTNAGLAAITTISVSATITQSAANPSLQLTLEADDAPGSTQTGIDLVVRHPTEWYPLTGTTSCTGIAQPCVAWSTTSTAEMSLLFSGLGQLVQVAAVPMAPNGVRGSYADVTTDYAELTVRYQLTDP